MHFPRLAIVDLETTGADASRDRITEIAILLVEGETLIETWSTLINPGMPIPPRIEAINGINDALVADAPRFEDVAERVRAKLEGAVFVAHNARFDYNFLRAGFERLGQRFEAPVMCTVKFSRALDPEQGRHGLDALIERNGYDIAARHRALDDAVIVWRFLQDCLKRHERSCLQLAWQRAYSVASVPRLPAGDLEALPDGPGVYALFGANGQVLDVGHARDLRSQVLGLFTGKQSDARRRRLAGQVRDVDARPAAGELHALLMEMNLKRRLGKAQPDGAFAWRWLRDAERGPVLEKIDLAGSDPGEWHEVYGCFRGPKEAETALRQLAARQQLCPQRIGLESGEGPCSAFPLKRCRGVCAGREEARLHDVRLAALLAALRLRPWPAQGALHIRESHAELAAVHVFDQWCYLGTAEDEGGLHELGCAPRRFDADIWRLLQRWLARSQSSSAAPPSLAAATANAPAVPAHS